MQRFPTLFLLFLALGLGAGRATALGLGKVTGSTGLGQTLSFAVGLRLDPGETLDAKCLQAEVTSGERLLPASLVRARFETVSNTGERRVRVTTTVPVDEPVVNIALSLGCPPTLSRSFVVLADPVVRGASAEAEEPTQPDRSESPLAAVINAVPPAMAAASVPTTAAATAKLRKQRAALNAPARTAVAAAASEPAPRPRRGNAAAAPSRSRGGPVLRLDPIEADALILPSLQMATSLAQPPDPAAPAASAPRFMDPEQEQRWHEQERLKAMETALLKLRSDSQATQRSLDQMQLRVRTAEASRYANPLVYLLAVLCALLAGGLIALWWLRRRDREAATWWAAQGDANAPVAGGSAPEEPDAPSSLPPIAPAPAPRREPAVATAFVQSAPTPMVSLVRPSEPEDAAGEPRRPMSAEELIDLEQQAEFFVVLGQDDAAIDLLMGHVRSTGGVSPLPYLKLLEIYRRRGEREPYDRIRERFNRRFNAYAPEWDVDPELGLSLEGYPEVMGRIEKTWAAPSQAMELLDASLFRRDAGPTFDVPAYRELLFLYGMARDLAERDTSPDGVDLLLPLGDEEASIEMSSLEATPPEPSVQEGHFSLDLDVSSDHPPLTLDDPDFKRDPR